MFLALFLLANKSLDYFRTIHSGSEMERRLYPESGTFPTIEKMIKAIGR